MQGNSLIEEFHGISLDVEKKPDEQIDAFSGSSLLDDLIKQGVLSKSEVVIIIIEFIIY